MIPWIKWTSFSVGPLTLQVWGLFVAIGIATAMWIIWKRAKQLGYEPDKFLDLALWMLILGFIFSRLFHVFFYESTFYFANPVEMLKVWKGGLSSYGGFFGAALGFFAYIKYKKISKEEIWAILDICSFGAIYGWIIARIGCFLIHDHIGISCDCAIAVNKPDGARLDMALLEIIGLLPLAVLFFFWRKTKLPKGWFTGILFVYYGVLRFILDFFRARDIPQADVRYGGLTPAQYFSFVFVGMGIWVLWKMKKREKLDKKS